MRVPERMAGARFFEERGQTPAWAIWGYGNDQSIPQRATDFTLTNGMCGALLQHDETALTLACFVYCLHARGFRRRCCPSGRSSSPSSVTRICGIQLGTRFRPFSEHRRVLHSHPLDEKPAVAALQLLPAGFLRSGLGSPLYARMQFCFRGLHRTHRVTHSVARRTPSIARPLSVSR